MVTNNFPRLLDPTYVIYLSCSTCLTTEEVVKIKGSMVTAHPGLPLFLFTKGWVGIRRPNPPLGPKLSQVLEQRMGLGWKKEAAFGHILRPCLASCRHSNFYRRLSCPWGAMVPRLSMGWARWVRYPCAWDKNNKTFTGRHLDWFENRIGPHLFRVVMMLQI